MCGVSLDVYVMLGACFVMPGSADPAATHTCGSCRLIDICPYMNRSHNDVFTMLGDYNMTNGLLFSLSS